MTMRGMRNSADLKAGLGLQAYGFVAATLALTVLGTTVIVRQLDKLTNPFFPPTMLEDDADRSKARVGSGRPLIDAFEEDSYAGVWRGMREPSLYQWSKPPPTDLVKAIRFTWVPSFHRPIVVRIDWLVGGAVRLTTVRAEGTGWGDRNKGDGRRVVRMLSPSERIALAEVMTSTQAFSGPDEGLLVGPDGSNWIFEATAPRIYHYEAEWSPQGQRREAGLFMLGLTGWNLEPVY